MLTLFEKKFKYSTGTSLHDELTKTDKQQDSELSPADNLSISSSKLNILQNSEVQGSDLHSLSTSAKISKTNSPRKDKHIIESPESKSKSQRRTSPRPMARQFNKKKEENLIENVGEEKKNSISPNTSQELIQQENTLINNKQVVSISSVSSSEQENENPKCYELNLKAIISKRDDVNFHGHVRAYFDESLQIKPKSKFSFIQRIKFDEYLKYITEELNELQRKKYNTISTLVDLLSPAYAKEEKNEKKHHQFCNDLLDMIIFCMHSSEESCKKSTYFTNSTKSPGEKITLFWDSALCGLELTPQIKMQYDNLLKILLAQVYRVFLMSEKLLELMNQHLNQANNKNPLSCISWEYFYVLCDAHSIVGIYLEQFKDSYNETCAGLAGKFIYIPDMWDFVRNRREKEEKNLPYYETVKKIDRMLLEIPVFKDYQFEEKNQSSLRKTMFNMF